MRANGARVSAGVQMPAAFTSTNSVPVSELQTDLVLEGRLASLLQMTPVSISVVFVVSVSVTYVQIDTHCFNVLFVV